MPNTSGDSFYQHLLHWLSGSGLSGRGRSPSSHRRRDRCERTRGLRAEHLETRRVLTSTIDFDSGTGVLTVTVDGASETFTLLVNGSNAVQCQSSVGISTTAGAQTIGFTNGGALNVRTSNSNIFPTITSIVFNGDADANQTVNFVGGNFQCPVTVNNSIENVGFSNGA